MDKGGYVYIIGNWTGDVLYTGVTSDLLKRIYQHKEGQGSGFSSKYHATKLLFYEGYGDIEWAIAREKEIKGWHREKKDALINSINPNWNDLAQGWFEDSSAPPAAARSE
ncbi:MAG: hypothetical protein DI551_09535 [Micavibrio aeruginosavorus]|uniref:GIY-YIG domain-containing protein n=1 Tax=Micavibrio aeruginosavorus TaxID=349221 RepID=A0A2W5PJJ3_9BACT|nr:MAG: hypothetical protein DI551_09535 [Micavibrio aeruginosavorus]